MLVYYSFVLLAILPYVFAGNKDSDKQFGQVPVKDSPVRSLNNLTVDLVDLSKNKGCKGNNCKSAVQGGRAMYSGGSDSGSFSDEDDPCEQVRDSGDCNGSRMRWYYSGRSGSCKRFSYSGCGGNSNNFRSRRRCESECGGDYGDGGGGGSRYTSSYRVSPRRPYDAYDWTHRRYNVYDDEYN